MTVRTRRILVFALTFPPILLAILPIYSIVVAPYSRAVVSVANAVLSLLKPPMHISITGSGGWEFSFEGLGAEHFRASIADLTLRSFDLALLPALLLATPKPLRQRALSLLQGVTAVFGLHVASAVAVSHVFLGLHFNRESVLDQTLLIVFATGGQVFGVALFLLLTWRFWVTTAPSTGARRGSHPTSLRNAPCLCGSGRKHKHCCGEALQARSNP